MAKISIIAQRVPFPPNKGEKLRTYYQIKRLCELGHSIQLFVPIENEQDVQDADRLSERLDVVLYTFYQPNRLLRYTKALITGSALSEASFYSTELSKKLVGCLRENEIVYLTASSLVKYVTQNKLHKSHRCLIDFMDVDSDKWGQYSAVSRWPMSWVYKRESKLISALERSAISLFDMCFVITEVEKAILSRLYIANQNISVLPNGINFRSFTPSKHKPKNEVNFLFVGVMDYKPNVDAVEWFVVNCWPTIKKKVPNAKLTVAGMNPAKKILSMNSKDIEVTGFVDDITPYFARSHVFVAPFNIARGVQNKVLQAMACALGVVSTSAGMEGIDARNNKHYLLADDADGFIENCIEISHNITKRHNMGKAASLMIHQNYAWENVLAPLEENIK